MPLSKEAIVNSLRTNDLAVLKAILTVDRNQTQDERQSEHTKYNNGRGWRPAHARMGSSIAGFFKRTGFVTTNQIAYFRKTDRSGNMRIALYWQQLKEAAETGNSYVMPAPRQGKQLVMPSKPKGPGRTRWTPLGPRHGSPYSWQRTRPVPVQPDRFNDEWANMKNEFAQREAAQERAAYEAKMRREEQAIHEAEQGEFNWSAADRALAEFHKAVC